MDPKKQRIKRKENIYIKIKFIFLYLWTLYSSALVTNAPKNTSNPINEIIPGISIIK